jgi:Protein of unknown function (DUF3086)
MNSDELQSPQPISETSAQSQEQTPDEQPNNSPVEPSVELPTDELPTEARVDFIVPGNPQEIEKIERTEKELQDLQRTENELREEIAKLQATYDNLQAQLSETQTALGKVVKEALEDLEARRQTLQISVEQLERRQERIRNEMRTTFAGTSQDLAIRVQGFKDYLVGSLQDLASAAEQLPLIPSKPKVEVERERDRLEARPAKSREAESGDAPQFAQQQFQETNRQIRRLIDQYRNKPDYYGPAWQLRRTFEPVHAERVSNWFFNLGGRGALRTMGSRLQNTLITSAVISILYELYSNRLRVLVLANSPERLGEWRRGLQDCLGIGRPDFGPGRGVALFESPESLAQNADRLTKGNQMPFIVIDDSEEEISLALLQFPLWLAFAPDPKMMKNFDDDF